MIVALGKACELAQTNLQTQQKHLEDFRDAFEKGVMDVMSDYIFNGNRQNRLPNISNISFENIEGEGLLITLDLQGIAVSTGSACSSGSLEPSPVIRALGQDDSISRGAIRFSFGKDNSMADIDYLLGLLPKAITNIRLLTAKK